MESSALGLLLGIDPGARQLALSLNGNQRAGRILAALALGDELVGQVVDVEKDGTLLLELRGERVRARSALDLRPGSVLNLRVLRQAPRVTLQIVSSDPARALLTALASRALSSPGGLVPLMASLRAVVEALHTPPASNPGAADSAAAGTLPADGGSGEALLTPPGPPEAKASASGPAPAPAGALRAPRETAPPPTNPPPVTPAGSAEKAPDAPATLRLSTPPGPPEAKASASGPAPAPAGALRAPPETTAPRPSSPPPVTPAGAAERTPQLPPGAQVSTIAPALSPAAPASLRLSAALVATARGIPPTSPEAGRLSNGLQNALAGLETALAESSVDPRALTPETLRKAIVSVGQPVEHALLELPEGAPAPSTVENDLRTALARTVRSPLADPLPDGLRELAARALSQVEARQALNALALAQGQLLFEVALRLPGGWAQAEILVEEDGGGQGDDETGGAIHLTLQLRPDGLGPLRVLVRLAGDEVSCYLVCQNPEAAGFVGDRLPELSSSLASQGLRVGALQALAAPKSSFSPLGPSRLALDPLLDALA